MYKIFKRTAQGASIGGIIGAAITALGTGAAVVVSAPVALPAALAIGAASAVASGASGGAIGTLVGGGLAPLQERQKLSTTTKSRKDECKCLTLTYLMRSLDLATMTLSET